MRSYYRLGRRGTMMGRTALTCCSIALIEWLSTGQTSLGFWLIPVLCSLGFVLHMREIESRWLQFAPHAQDGSDGIVLRRATVGTALLKLDSATLVGADLRHAQLADVTLVGADLSGADLAGAVLVGGVLRGCSLERADLRSADLCGADLQAASLQGADLRGACFARDGSSAELDGPVGSADLTGALYDGTTRWPCGFEPSVRGCLRVPDSWGGPTAEGWNGDPHSGPHAPEKVCG